MQSSEHSLQKNSILTINTSPLPNWPPKRIPNLNINERYLKIRPQSTKRQIQRHYSKYITKTFDWTLKRSIQDLQQWKNKEISSKYIYNII